MKRMLWVAALWIAVPASAQDVERLGGGEVAVYNLAGEVDIVRGSGSEVVVRITRGGRDAASLSIETGELRGRETLRVIYPDDDIVYPEMGRGSNTNISVRANGTFSDGGRGRDDRVHISGRGNGLEAWADLRIEVPAGHELDVYQAVGSVRAEEIQGNLSIDTGSGSVSAVDIRGTLSIDTGSGSVVARGVDGEVMIDTGSGGVEVAELAGSVIEIDTGSGSVEGYGLSGEEVTVDTGSGRIELGQVSAEVVLLDTGSGGIDVELLTDVDRLEADTGSGSVTVRAPAGLGAEVDVETGSGGIDLDFPLEVRSVRRDHVRGTIGDGRGQISIDTGSGSIRLIRSNN